MCCHVSNFGETCASHPWFPVLLVILIVWDSVWKLIALWKAARNKQLCWFICLAIFNTLGVLPIIYILIDMKKKLAKEL